MKKIEGEMEWQNIEQIRDAIRQQGAGNRSASEWTDKPAERWGLCSVACNKEMYIIGGYNGK